MTDYSYKGDPIIGDIVTSYQKTKDYLKSKYNQLKSTPSNVSTENLGHNEPFHMLKDVPQKVVPTENYTSNPSGSRESYRSIRQKAIEAVNEKNKRLEESMTPEELDYYHKHPFSAEPKLEYQAVQNVKNKQEAEQAQKQDSDQAEGEYYDKKELKKKAYQKKLEELRRSK